MEEGSAYSNYSGHPLIALSAADPNIEEYQR